MPHIMKGLWQDMLVPSIDYITCQRTRPDSLKNWLMFTFVSSKHAQYYISNKTLLNRKQKQCSLSDAEGPIQQFIISH